MTSLLCAVGLTLMSAGAHAVTFNFADADIGSVIAAVSDMTGKNFIVDPRVKGKVTVISSSDMSPDAAYQVFLSVLNVHGFAAVPAGKAIKIVPAIDAKQEPIPTVEQANPRQGDSYVTEVVRVQNVAAAQLVPILRPLLPQPAHLAASQEGNVLVVSSTAANVARMAQIIERIDREGNASIEVIPLTHASADEVARVLSSLERQAGQGQRGGMPKVVADTRTNSVLLSGQGPELLRLKAIIAHLDTPLGEQGNSRVIYLHYGQAADIAKVLKGIAASEGGKGKSAATGKVNIQADEATNALVLSGPPDLLRDLQLVVRQLDVRRAQILVEAIIAEVSVDKANELGVQWGIKSADERGAIGVINFGGSGSGLNNLLSGTPSVGDGLSLLLGDSNLNTFRFGALIRALAGDANTNILSTPSLVTMDNQEAEIVVGQNVPFVTGSYTSTGNGSTPTNPFQTIQRQDVGLTLKVKPQINEGNAVRLDVTQEVSSIASATTGAADLVTNKRSLKTSVMVDDGHVIVLGGLIDDNVNESVQRVPGLGDIPVIGGLFSYKKTTKLKRNLMVFLHPVILRDARQSAALSGEKYNYMRARQLEMGQRGVALMPHAQAPVMPKLDDTLSLPPPYQPPAATPVKP